MKNISFVLFIWCFFKKNASDQIYYLNPYLVGLSDLALGKGICEGWKGFKQVSHSNSNSLDSSSFVSSLEVLNSLIAYKKIKGNNI